MLRKKLVLLIFLLAVAFVAGCGGQGPDSSQEPSTQTVTITDNAGRTVEVPYPVEEAVVVTRYNNELVRAIGAIDHVISVDMNTAQDREFWSEFDPENTVGTGQRELNYEKIIELAPQVLILPQNGTWQEAEETLAPFDIKVVVVSGYDTGDFINQVTNLGKIFGHEAGAEEFIAWYNSPLKYIEKQLAGEEKRTVYLETLTEYSTSFTGDYYADMLNFAGADHIFQELPEGLTGSIINPEDVILRNPEVIVKMITPDHALAGTGLYEAPLLEQRERVIAEIKNRPAWDEITAVQNDEVYLMSQFGHGGASKLVGAVYIAKWLYPELMTELDPQEIERQWLEDLQGFRYIDGHFHPMP